MKCAFRLGKNINPSDQSCILVCVPYVDNGDLWYFLIGCTALQLAASNGWPQVVHKLVQVGTLYGMPYVS